MNRQDGGSVPHNAMAQAVRVGDTVYLSGQGALRWDSDDHEVVGEGNSEAQAEQCFANIAASLASVGARLDHVVRLTCFITDVAHYEGYRRVKTRLFTGTYPASTTVIVTGLLDPRFLMEVEAVAVVTDS